MIKVTTKDDGSEFLGTSAMEIVSQMRNTMWNAPTHKRDYIADVVERIEEMSGVLSDMLQPMTEGDEASSRRFLQFLEQAGAVKIEHGVVA